MTADQQQDALLQAVLARLERGDARDDKWPDSRGDYWPLCPLHQDQHSGSFAIGLRGFKCFACGESGGLRKLAEKLQVSVAVLQSKAEGKATHTLTLREYAEAKRLDADFLRSLGVAESTYRGQTRLVLPYYDADGQEVARRYRLSMSGARRFLWAKGSKVLPYGLWRLAEARKAPYIILVEGESDCHTLWSHGISALGIPGASTFKPEWAKSLDGLTVYLWREPDEGGSVLLSKVGAALPDVRVLDSQGRKDASEAHILGDDVPALIQELMGKARSYREMRAEAGSAEAARARQLAQRLLQEPDILAELETLLPQLGLAGETQNGRLLYLALTSRLLDKPISVVVKGPSSAGKSFVVETVLRTMPDDAHLDFTSMSEHALIYDDRPIAGRHIVLYEASGLGADRQGQPSTLAYCVRSLLSEGRIAYTTVEKTPDGMQPRHIERDGPTGLLTTTTWTSLHPENETRMLSVTVRDDPRQTAAIFAALADRANGQGPTDPDVTPWQALQTWLELAGERRVTIPFAHELARLCDPRAVRLRRDFGKVLVLIQTHAMLHQLRREKDSQGRVVATLQDYAAVHDLVADAIAEGTEAMVSETMRETVKAVADLMQDTNGAPVTLVQLAARLRLDKSAASRRVRSAREHGYLVDMQDKRGKPMQIALGDPLPEEADILPTPAQLAAVVHEKGLQVQVLQCCSDCEGVAQHTFTAQPQEDCCTVAKRGGVVKPTLAGNQDKENVLHNPAQTTATLQHPPAPGKENVLRKHPDNAATLQHPDDPPFDDDAFFESLSAAWQDGE